jgi:hypothetical protein
MMHGYHFWATEVNKEGLRQGSTFIELVGCNDQNNAIVTEVTYSNMVQSSLTSIEGDFDFFFGPCESFGVEDDFFFVSICVF